MSDAQISALTLDARVKPSDKTLFRNLDGEAVLLSMSAGAYFGLDPVGTRIWELIVERGVLRDVAAEVVAEFEVEQARAEADLLKLVSDMLRNKLVVLEHAR